VILCGDVNLSVANYESGSDMLVGCRAVRPFEFPENATLYFDEVLCAGEVALCTPLNKQRVVKKGFMSEQ
jgi:hypothetical protein